MSVRRVYAVGVVAVAVLGAGGVGVMRDTRSAAAAPPVQTSQMARLTRRVAMLEQEVTALQRTVQRICARGQLVSFVSVDASSQLRPEYVRCSPW